MQCGFTQWALSQHDAPTPPRIVLHGCQTSPGWLLRGWELPGLINGGGSGGSGSWGDEGVDVVDTVAAAGGAPTEAQPFHGPMAWSGAEVASNVKIGCVVGLATDTEEQRYNKVNEVVQSPLDIFTAIPMICFSFFCHATFPMVSPHRMRCGAWYRVSRIRF
jgi:hypothetical protein